MNRATPTAHGLACALAACAALCGCDHRKPDFEVRPGAERAPAAYTLAEPDLESRKLARWWSLPDGKAPEQSEYYPCSDCHDDEVSDAGVRELTEDHEDLELKHGGERVWCLDCHHRIDRDAFVDGPGKAPRERADRTCGRCHAATYRDFEHGVHGKRLGTFDGERVLAGCLACHDPHAPAIPPRAPQPIGGSR